MTADAKIDILVPISPRPSWWIRAELLAASFRRYYPNTRVHLSIGADWSNPTEVAHLNAGLPRWKNNPLNAWSTVTTTDFMRWAGTRSPFLATMDARFSTDHLRGDFVIIADCDILCVSSFPELFETDAVCGTMAHVAPLPEADMKYLYVIDEAPWSTHLHPFSGNGIMGPIDAESNWYANSGFIFAPRHLFEKLIEPYHEAIWRMRHGMRDSYWFDQLALALAVAKSGVPSKVLPLCYNFPNQTEFDHYHPRELADIRIMHYLRENIIHRERDFADVGALRRLVARTDLPGSNEVVREVVAELIHIFEPPPLNHATEAPWA